MLESLAVLLVAFALIQFMVVLAAKLSEAGRRRTAQRWARRAHEHDWRARLCTVTMAENAQLWTLVVEECPRCPAMRLQAIEGTWAINRFGELVNLAPEAPGLRAMR